MATSGARTIAARIVMQSSLGAATRRGVDRVIRERSKGPHCFVGRRACEAMALIRQRHIAIRTERPKEADDHRNPA